MEGQPGQSMTHSGQIYEHTNTFYLINIDKTSRVEEEDSGYLLHIEGYRGDAGDSLAFNNGMKFTTQDRDNDKFGGNCAQHYKAGGWWFYK